MSEQSDRVHALYLRFMAAPPQEADACFAAFVAAAEGAARLTVLDGDDAPPVKRVLFLTEAEATELEAAASFAYGYGYGFSDPKALYGAIAKLEAIKKG